MPRDPKHHPHPFVRNSLVCPLKKPDGSWRMTIGCPKFNQKVVLITDGSVRHDITDVLGYSVVSDSLWPHGLQSTRFLCPWGFPRQESWSGLPCPSPGDLPTQESNPGLPHCRWILYYLSHQWRPTYLQSRLTDTENKFMVIRGKGGARDKLGNWDWHIHTIMYKIDN